MSRPLSRQHSHSTPRPASASRFRFYDAGDDEMSPKPAAPTARGTPEPDVRNKVRQRARAPPVEVEEDPITLKVVADDTSSIGSDWQLPASVDDALQSTRRLPLCCYTCCAMSVPILLLAILSGYVLMPLVSDMIVLSNHAPLLNAISDCNEQLMNERSLLGPWMATGTDASRVALLTARVDVDSCRTKVLRLLGERSTKRPQAFASAVTGDYDTTSQLRYVRATVDARGTGATAAREFFSGAVVRQVISYTTVATLLETRTAVELLQLRSLAILRSDVDLTRSVGDEAARVASSPALQREYTEAYSQARASLAVALDRATGDLDASFAAWMSSAAAQNMWRLFANRSADLLAGTALPATDAWWVNVTAGMQGLRSIDRVLLNRVTTYNALTTTVIRLSVAIGVGLLLCVAAAVFLARKQTHVRNDLKRRMARMEATRAALANFVPQRFLASMGYDNITAVPSGAAVEVEAVLLYADIRGFPIITSDMPTTELFDWVHQYYGRVAGVIERYDGVVATFAGDALLAVFHTTRAGMLCAAAIQSDVQQLNVANLVRDGDVDPIDVGVGLHYERVALGVVGPEAQRTCAVVSAHAKLAAQLERLAKQLGCKIIVSAALVEQLTPDEVHSMRMRCLGHALATVGDDADSPVYEVFQCDDRALQQYKTETRSAFESLAAVLTSDPQTRDRLHDVSPPLTAKSRPSFRSQPSLRSVSASSSRVSSAGPRRTQDPPLPHEPTPRGDDGDFDAVSHASGDGAATESHLADPVAHAVAELLASTPAGSKAAFAAPPTMRLYRSLVEAQMRFGVEDVVLQALVRAAGRTSD